MVNGNRNADGAYIHWQGVPIGKRQLPTNDCTTNAHVLAAIPANRGTQHATPVYICIECGHCIVVPAPARFDRLRAELSPTRAITPADYQTLAHKLGAPSIAERQAAWDAEVQAAEEQSKTTLREYDRSRYRSRKKAQQS